MFLLKDGCKSCLQVFVLLNVYGHVKNKLFDIDCSSL